MCMEQLLFARLVAVDKGVVKRDTLSALRELPVQQGKIDMVKTNTLVAVSLPSSKIL